MPATDQLDPVDRLAEAARATVSIHVGGLDGSTTFERDAERSFPAASTFKVALVAALYRSGVDLDEEVLVRAELPSGSAGATYVTTQDYDQDDAVWDRLGSTTSLRWLAERAIVRSSNLATNLLLDRVGTDAVNAVYAGTGCVVEHGIEDPAPGANVVTARGLSTVLTRLHPEVEAVMARCEDDDMAAAGLPSGTYFAHKPGWFEGICHDHGIVRPVDRDPFVMTVLTRADLPEPDHRRLVADLASAVWQHHRP